MTNYNDQNNPVATTSVCSVKIPGTKDATLQVLFIQFFFK